MAEAWRVPFSQFLKGRGVPADQRHAYDHAVAAQEGGGAGEAQEHWMAFQRRRAWDRAAADMVKTIRLKHLSLRTERSYLSWLHRFQVFVDVSPGEVTSSHVEAFLTRLAVDQDVSASTQNQAFSALLFFFRHVLRRELDADAFRAKQRRRLPVVLTREEVAAVLSRLPPRFALMARFIYGAGLRLQECLEMRVKDVDLERGILTIRSGKGDKDRQTVLPASLRAPWAEHVRAVRVLHEQDRRADLPGVALPLALERKYPNAGKEWGWFWAFPADKVSTDPRSGVVRRHHQHPSAFQKHFRRAVQGAGIAKAASSELVRMSQTRIGA